MMTMVLKDSLGGNCRTVMVATISPDQEQLDESISTCRFAMRVALVRNQVLLNEEVDPSLVIRRLKQEIRDLREEIRMIKGEAEDRGPLTPDEVGRLDEQVRSLALDCVCVLGEGKCRSALAGACACARTSHRHGSSGVCVALLPRAPCVRRSRRSAPTTRPRPA